MSFVSQIFYTAASLLIHYNVLTICLLLVAAYGFVKYRSDTKRIIRKVASFCLAVAILIGIPMGIIEIWFPVQANSDNVVKGVTAWMQQ